MIGKILLFFLSIVLIYFIIIRVIKKFYPFPMPAFLGIFIDSRWRKLFQPPKKIIMRSGIKNGMSVMDLGCGVGTYTLDAARAVGPDGKVCAVDVQLQMIKKLQNKLKQLDASAFKNITVQVADACKLPFSDQYFDVIFMVTVLPEIPEKKVALQEISRVLKKDGLLSISECVIDPDYPLQSTTISWCQKAGFMLVKSYGSFMSYTLQFKKKVENEKTI